MLKKDEEKRKSRSKDNKHLHHFTQTLNKEPSTTTSNLPEAPKCLFLTWASFFKFHFLLVISNISEQLQHQVGKKWVWPWPAELMGRKSSVRWGRALNTEKRSIRDSYQACRKPFPGPLPRQGHTCSWAALGTSWACAQSNKFTSITLTSAHHMLVRTKSALTHWAIR